MSSVSVSVLPRRELIIADAWNGSTVAACRKVCTFYVCTPSFSSDNKISQHQVPIQHAARQVTEEDYRRFTHILAADEANLRSLEQKKPRDATAEIRLWGSYLDNKPIQDPYYGGTVRRSMAVRNIFCCANGLPPTERFRGVLQAMRAAVERIPRRGCWEGILRVHHANNHAGQVLHPVIQCCTARNHCRYLDCTTTRRGLGITSRHKGPLKRLLHDLSPSLRSLT